MPELPMLPASCSLDREEATAQAARYRRAGAGARVVERSERRLVVELAPGADLPALERALDVEARCCPFFELALDRTARRLSVGVAGAAHAPALDAIALALGVARC